MLEYGKIYEIDSVLSDEEWNNVYDCFEQRDWKFVAGELNLRQNGVPVRTFWHKPLPLDEYIHDLFKFKIETILNKKIQITRLYGNSQTHSQSAWVHTDDSEHDGKTYGSFVYYLHKNWLPQFGGHLIFVDDAFNPKKVIKSIFPTENTAVLFNSMMPHMALEPTVYCLEHRVSIAAKFFIKE